MTKGRLLVAGFVIVLLAIGGNTWIGLRTSSQLRHDEQTTKDTSAHTRLIQRQGEPVGVCLLDALKAVEPLLLRVPAAQRPLEGYIRLQSHRYLGVRCPD